MYNPIKLWGVKWQAGHFLCGARHTEGTTPSYQQEAKNILLHTCSPSLAPLGKYLADVDKVLEEMTLDNANTTPSSLKPITQKQIWTYATMNGGLAS